MNMGIYLENGYFNPDHAMNNGCTYSFIIGGRGTGKTFGCLQTVIDKELKFIYMRRTQTQVDMIRSDDFNPFKSLTRVLGERYNFKIKKINKDISGVYETAYNEDKQQNEATGPALGYVLALSTISNIRGFDASDIDVIIYDEFIPEKHEKPIRAEGEAFLNAIETISRNREIDGREPLKVLCLSNANDLVCPLFIEMGVVHIVEKMVNRNVTYRTVPEKAAAFYMLTDSPISKKKAETSLYQLAGGSDFTKMSILNDFSAEQKDLIRSCNIIEYKPLVQVGEICIYIHKSNRTYYITGMSSGSPEIYGSSVMELKRFARNYYFLWLAYLNRLITFESYLYQALFEKYFNVKK